MKRHRCISFYHGSFIDASEALRPKGALVKETGGEMIWINS